MFALQLFEGTVHTQQKKDTDRRAGKGRRCCFGYRIYSIPFRKFCNGQFEEDELHQEVKKNRINLSISLNRPGAKILEWQGIISFLSPKQQRQPRLLCQDCSAQTLGCLAGFVLLGPQIAQLGLFCLVLYCTVDCLTRIVLRGP